MSNRPDHLKKRKKLPQCRLVEGRIVACCLAFNVVRPWQVCKIKQACCGPISFCLGTYPTFDNLLKRDPDPLTL